MLSDAEIFEKVQGVLVDALGVDDDEVTPTATLEGDLGAESIDFLDIFFRLEKAFTVKISRSEFLPDALFSPESGFVKDGSVTPEGIAELKAKAPHFDADKLAKNPKIETIKDLTTVQTLVNFVRNKLAA
ncbi:MAG: Acyl carrier protein [Planctomycetaceae bacterium]|nr:Acyl carrier protein [Planctomycetaceae bacterium]